MHFLLRRIAAFLRNRPLWARCALALVPDVERMIRIDPIGLFRIRLMRNRSLWLRHPLAHEQFMLGALKHLIRPGDVVFDVGANIGLYSRFILSSFGAGQAVCFEPMTDNIQLLLSNLTIGGLTQKALVVPVALADSDGEEDLQVDDVMSATACLSRLTNGKACEGRRKYGLQPLIERVQVARLDSFIEKGELTAPQVIKVDIEGAEPLFLRGARATLERYHPRLAIELHGLDKAREVLHLLNSFGYTSFGSINLDGKRVYKELRPADLVALRDYYDLQYIVASHEHSDICEPIQPYVPTPV